VKATVSKGWIGLPVPIRCPECGKVFGTLHGMKVHVARKHASTLMEWVEIVKVDRKTMKSVSYGIPVMPGPRDVVMRRVERACNVGDFAIVRGEAYRRVRGGFRKATNEDMAEFIAAGLGEE